MSKQPIVVPATRRSFLATAATSFVAFGATGAFAEQLARTPRQTAGPFYPDKLPLDTDNDLIVINDAIDPAVGQITHLSGRVLSQAGEPIRGATVEIWQCDANGIYYHSRDRRQDKRDRNFQSFGRFTTATKGEYYFRTIKPMPYPGRTPHIHVKVKHGGKDLLTTQMYVKGHDLNERDGIWRSVRDAKQRDNITVDFKAIPDSKINELAARFDIVLGLTPKE